MDMTVFRMNDFDWVCADSEEQAKEFYHELTGVDKEDIEEDFNGEVSLKETMFIPITDLSEEELKEVFKTDTWNGIECAVMTFEKVIERNKQKSPYIIASTEY